VEEDLMSKQRLRRGREISGLTMGQAARLLGMRVPDLSLMELNGVHYDDDRLPALAALYQTTVAWLLGDDPKLCDVEHTGDRATVREVMEMWSTPERDDVR
jgi:transcriptional regulator with XRE-family HTH domain